MRHSLRLLQQLPSSFLSLSLSPLPTATVLSRADTFFAQSTHSHVLTTNDAANAILSNGTPSILLLGRSNVGKSTLLNRLLTASSRNSKDIAGAQRTKTRQTGYAYTGRRAGVTQALGVYALTSSVSSSEKQKYTLHILDTPGYGPSSRPAWGKVVTKFLALPRQKTNVRQAYIILDASLPDGAKKSDLLMVEFLRQHRVPFGIVMSKVDQALSKMKNTEEKQQELCTKMEAVLQQVGPGVDVCALSAEKNTLMGMSTLRYSVLRACGFL